jgi:hypothetical protein
MPSGKARMTTRIISTIVPLRPGQTPAWLASVTLNPLERKSVPRSVHTLQLRLIMSPMRTARISSVIPSEAMSRPSMTLPRTSTCRSVSDVVTPRAAAPPTESIVVTDISRPLSLD